MKVYGIATCDTCREAMRALAALNPQFHDVRKEPLTREDIDRFLAGFGDDLINRKSATWRGLSERDRQLSAGDLLKLHPTVMKRPVLEKDGALHLGWDAATQAALLG